MIVENLVLYKSILPFRRIELADFTVLVGLNGAGKSQFLDGLSTGAIRSDVLSSLDPPEGMENTLPSVFPDDSRIALLTSQGGVPESLTKAATSRYVSANQGGLNPQPPQMVIFKYERSVRLQPFAQLLQSLCPRPLAEIPGLSDPWSLDPSEFHRILKEAGFDASLTQIGEIYYGASLALTEAEFQPGRVRMNTALASFFLGISEVSRRTGKPAYQVTETDVSEVGAYGAFQIFTPPVAQIFSSYRDRRADNDLAKQESDRGGQTYHLSEVEFLAEFGPPPWDEITKILQAMGLPYRAKAPSYRPDVPVSFRLERTEGGTEIGFNDLSSGQRVLARFALSIFSYDPLRTRLTIPKLLLLDEMDNSLHPAMVANWMAMVENELVKERGVKCILTTHSPTTVALAPQGSLYEMVEGKPGPQKIDKQAAINRLTTGIPTLSIDFSGRRQVFVEADTDARSYQALHDFMKTPLQLPRNLSFISAGFKDKDKLDRGTGCAAVRRLTETLASRGSTSVFGIVDWDNKNNPESRTRVVGHSTYYALDNILLDPLLIGALLLSHKQSIPGIDHTFVSIGSLDLNGLAAIVEAVTRIMVFPDGIDITPVKSIYQDGIELYVPKVFQAMRGHDLEDVVAASNGRLRGFHKRGAGELTFAIVDDVIRQHPQLCPKALSDLFIDLASSDVL